MWLRLKLLLAGGTAAMVLALAGGSAILLQTNDHAARSAARATLQRAGQLVDNTLNRHLLQVDGALASLPGIFAALRPSGSAATPAEAGHLLRELNFQTSAFRDLLLVAEDGTIWAAARPRTRGRTTLGGISANPGDQSFGASVVLGPSRNPVTGDWSLYLARPIEVPTIGPLAAVAEIPVPVLVKLLSEATLEPGTRVRVERANGQLLASIPVQELEIGDRQAPTANSDRAGGRAVEGADATGRSILTVARPSLYDDIWVVVSIETEVATAAWIRSRSWILATVAAAILLILAFASALFASLRQRERLEAERIRSGAVLENAIEAMSDGFVMWDREDRLVTCNQRYLDLYAASAAFLKPGAKFEDIIRAGAETGQYPDAEGHVDEFVDETVSWHQACAGTMERRLPDGRWLLITERRMGNGGVVGIRTDITALKHTLGELAAANERATRGAAEAQRQNLALTERDRALDYLAHHDDLTKLPNRAHFRKRLQEMLSRSAVSGEGLALLYLDLDKFKDVNDTLGHPIGDALLREVARRLLHCAGDRQPVFRLGGDEFAVICASANLPGEAERLSAKLIEALDSPYDIDGRWVNIGASVGIAIASEQDADSLLRNADLALYRAKAVGRGTHFLFAPELAISVRARIDMENDLKLALRRGEFDVAYQPIFDLTTDRVCGLEALLRWRHPVKGPISPADFIPVAEETGLISEIGAWVLRRACEDVATLPHGVKLAVNMSPLQLTAGDVVATVADALSRSGLDPGRLELEITETALVGNDRNTTENLDALRNLGLSLVLDDFGTGYSSLSHLRSFPLSKIKIDQSFVREMVTRSDSSAIVRSVAQLAASLGMDTTAEGIETAEQLDRVREAGCTQAQGYLLGRPQPILATIASLHLRVPHTRSQAA